VLQISPGPGQRQLTIVLARPRDAPDDWPRGSCSACRVDVELTGLFGAREGMDAFFSRAMQEAVSIENAFSRQAQERAERPTPALRQLADGLAAEAKRCGVPLEPALLAVQGALEQLDSARARFYAGEKPELPDAGAVIRSWESAGVALEELPVAVGAARAVGWPLLLRPRQATRLRLSALHLDLAGQVAALPSEDKPVAAQWIALALAPDPEALDRRLAGLPRIRDLADADARLDWVDPRPDVPVRVPGVSRPVTLRVREWRAAPHGRRCIGPLGAAPVRDRDDDARAVADLLGADERQRLRIARADDIPAARERARRARTLLCKPPSVDVADLLGADERQRLRIARADDIPAARERARRARTLLCKPPSVDVADLFTGLEEKELGAVAERLDAIHASLDPRHDDELSRAISARAAELLCKLLDPETIQRRVASVVGYKIFVEGGTHVLDYLPGPLVCAGRAVPAREIRHRLREAYRAALDKHGVLDRLCPVRAGKCPEEIAASVRRLFSLQRPELAAPASVQGRALDFPPPFGFSDQWVEKLDRCAREACEALSRLRSEAPRGQFEGAVCPPRTEGSEQPQEVSIERPEAPTSVTLSSCDAHAGVRLTLRRRPDAGTLVSIASAHQFRYGSESVSRQGRHPQLGRIFERVADLTDPDRTRYQRLFAGVDAVVHLGYRPPGHDGGDRDVPQVFERVADLTDPGDVARLADGVFEVALTPTVANQVFYFFSLRRRDY